MRWWLAGDAKNASPDSVQRALDELVARGLVRRKNLAGHDPVYSRADGAAPRADGQG